MPLIQLSKNRIVHISYPPHGGIKARFMVFAGRRDWWSWPESNRRPPACKTGALPIELQPLMIGKPGAGRPAAHPLAHLKNMVGLSGFEPLTSRLSGGRSNQLSYRPIRSRSRAGQREPSPQRRKKEKSGATANLSDLRSFERR